MTRYDILSSKPLDKLTPDELNELHDLIQLEAHNRSKEEKTRKAYMALAIVELLDERIPRKDIEEKAAAIAKEEGVVLDEKAISTVGRQSDGLKRLWRKLAPIRSYVPGNWTPYMVAMAKDAKRKKAYNEELEEIERDAIVSVPESMQPSLFTREELTKCEL